MLVGVPKEIKDNENRVALVPASAHAFREQGHDVLVEIGAGAGSGILDEEYEAAGATLVATASEVWEQAGLVVKVKEPLPVEIARMRPGQILFTYFHFAASRELTVGCQESGAVCVAYETMEGSRGGLPCLVPMSEVAGRMAVQEGAKYLEKPMEGRGILLGGVPGVEPGHVVILGGGIVGTNAAKIAAGLGARVTILDISLDRLRQLDDILPANVTTLYSNTYNIRENLRTADLLVGAVLIPGAKAPSLVTRADLGRMQQGAVIVDVAVDQGGCVETIHPTTHSAPTYIVDGVLHYGVANMPGAVGRTSTFALTNATTPFALQLATHGWRDAAQRNREVRTGLNIVDGQITYEAVAATFGLTHTPVDSVLS